MKISYKDLVDRTYPIIKTKLEPFHYSKMYDYVSNNYPRIEGNTKHIENYRNFLDYEDSRFIKLGDGWFTLSEWLDSKQKRLFSFGPNELEWDKKIVSETTIEVGRRFTNLFDKYNDGPINHLFKFIKGKIPEMHIKEFFRKKYSNNIIFPNNAYNEPDKYDFKFVYKNKELNFDVKKIGEFNGEDAIWIEESRIKNDDYYIGFKSNGNLKAFGFVSNNEIKNAKVIPSPKYLKKYFVFSWKKWHDLHFMFVYLNHLNLGFDLKEITRNGYLYSNNNNIPTKKVDEEGRVR